MARSWFFPTIPYTATRPPKSRASSRVRKTAVTTDGGRLPTDDTDDLDDTDDIPQRCPGYDRGKQTDVDVNVTRQLTSPEEGGVVV
jgi:hypothetical protein